MATADVTLGTASWPRMPAEDSGPAATRGATSRRYRLAYRITSRPVAAATAIACIALLAVAALQLRHLRLGFGQISDLPQSSAPQRAARNASRGFAPEILAPVTVLILGQGVSAGLWHPRLARLEAEIERQPRVAGVLGPREQPTPARLGIFLGAHGNLGGSFRSPPQSDLVGADSRRRPAPDRRTMGFEPLLLVRNQTGSQFSAPATPLGARCRPSSLTDLNQRTLYRAGIPEPTRDSLAVGKTRVRAGRLQSVIVLKETRTPQKYRRPSAPSVGSSADRLVRISHGSAENGGASRGAETGALPFPPERIAASSPSSVWMSACTFSN